MNAMILAEINCHYVSDIRTQTPLVLDQNYINTKNQVIKAERRILKELGFCVHVKHPHKVSLTYSFISILVRHYSFFLNHHSKP